MKLSEQCRRRLKNSETPHRADWRGATANTCNNCDYSMSVYVGFKTLFYAVRHLDSTASYLPTGLHVGFFRSWPSLYLTSSFSLVFLVLSLNSTSTSMLFWLIFLLHLLPGKGGLRGAMIQRAMQAVTQLLVGPPLQDRSKEITRTKRNILVLQVGGWVYGLASNHQKKKHTC
jgi:hypothetical protein